MIQASDEQVLDREDKMIQSRQLFDKILNTANVIEERRRKYGSSSYVVVPASLVPMFAKAMKKKH